MGPVSRTAGRVLTIPTLEELFEAFPGDAVGD
jgi:hypothetical protein